MPQAAHPTVADVQALYAATGLIPDATQYPFNNVKWAQQLASAIKTFQERTGRTVPAVMGSRSYDPPTNSKGFRALGQDLASDGGGQITVTVSGITQVLGTDYYLGPDNADNEGKPWTWIELPFLVDQPYLRAARRCIQITGPWGQSSLVPDDVWEAERQYAALLCVPEISVTISNGIYKIADTQYANTGDQIPLSAESKMWKATFEAAVTNNKRVVNFLG